MTSLSAGAGESGEQRIRLLEQHARRFTRRQPDDGAARAGRRSRARHARARERRGIEPRGVSVGPREEHRIVRGGARQHVGGGERLAPPVRLAPSRAKHPAARGQRGDARAQERIDRRQRGDVREVDREPTLVPLIEERHPDVEEMNVMVGERRRHDRTAEPHHLRLELVPRWIQVIGERDDLAAGDRDHGDRAARRAERPDRGAVEDHLGGDRRVATHRGDAQGEAEQETAAKAARARWHGDQY